MVDNINSNEKSLGNEFQLEITQLKEKIKEFENSSNQKDIKITLFNQTLATLGETLKKKDTEIKELNIKLNELEKEENNEIDKLNCLVENNNTYEKEMEDKLNLIKNELSISKGITEKLSLECERKDNLIRENHKEIEIIKEKLSGNVAIINELKEENRILSQEIGAKANTSSGEEINGLKEHIIFYKSQVDELRSQLIETQNEIDLLTQPHEETNREIPLLGTVKKKKDIKRRK
jgi:chromosome segregation ATPase